MQKRRQFSADFKAKVAIEALKEQQTLQELAHKYEPGRRCDSSKPDILMEAGVSSEFCQCIHQREEKRRICRFLQALRRDRWT